LHWIVDYMQYRVSTILFCKIHAHNYTCFSYVYTVASASPPFEA
jgi:hypothetical protein